MAALARNVPPSLAHEVIATEESLRESLFGPSLSAECVIARMGTEPVGFAVWFQS